MAAHRIAACMDESISMKAIMMFLTNKQWNIAACHLLKVYSHILVALCNPSRIVVYGEGVSANSMTNKTVNSTANVIKPC